MRILMVIRSLVVGGAERQCVEFAIELAKRGHAVSFCTLSDSGTLGTRLRASNIEPVSLAHRGPADFVRSGRRLRVLARKLEPHVIYSFLPVSNVLCAIALPRQLTRRLVWGIRAASLENAQLGFFSKLALEMERWLAFVPTMIVANSHEGKRNCERRGFAPDRIRVVENAVDVATFHYDVKRRQEIRQREGVQEARRIVLMLARIDPIKDYETFIRAAARVAAKRPDVDFWSIGGGNSDLRLRLETTVESLGMQRRFRWFGEMTESKKIADLLMAGDGAVSASLTEGFPNAVAECVACGLRVVGTDVGDTWRIIGGNGECVPVGDAEAMSAAILRQLGREEMREQVRQDFLAQFDPKILFDRHEASLAEVANANSARDRPVVPQ